MRPKYGLRFSLDGVRAPFTARGLFNKLRYIFLRESLRESERKKILCYAINPLNDYVVYTRMTRK